MFIMLNIFICYIILILSFDQKIVVLHYLACKGGAISLMRVQVNSLIREFHHAKLPYKQVTNNIVFNHDFQPQIIQIRHFPKIHFGYIFAYKGDQIGNSLISKQATPLQARLCSTMQYKNHPQIYPLFVMWNSL
ncbi:Hypothetical_protein [Hexamita inflata]|uniref:Hypothetical_protein n=1 Tax=Hexamita inflata TaxID=28002 RepID=A0AA86TE02_9EUKA|nr:Hypothetical protein HINF_LOCUS3749 [Hexamita inflata]